MSTDGFPRLSKRFQNDVPYWSNLVLTNIPHYAPNDKNPDRLFYWFAENPSRQLGFICERLGKILTFYLIK